jgi:SP family general alpha glucoside:H+ symporter-like MFS transporter
MCFIIGQLISAGVLKGFSGHTGQWAYRIPFAIQWVWPVILIPLVYIAPESPWHLARMGRLEEAEQPLKGLQSKTATNVNTANTLAIIIHTDSYEEINKIGTSYLDCFKGPELRRSEIAGMTFASQAFIGIQFAYSSTYFFQSIGVGTNTSYALILVVPAWGFLPVSLTGSVSI